MATSDEAHHSRVAPWNKAPRSSSNQTLVVHTVYATHAELAKWAGVPPEHRIVREVFHIADYLHNLGSRDLIAVTACMLRFEGSRFYATEYDSAEPFHPDGTYRQPADVNESPLLQDKTGRLYGFTDRQLAAIYHAWLCD